MNCQQFTSLMVEAARGRMMDAAARDGATRHAETCAACAARLAQEQSLTNALRTVAAGMKDLGAPARVEANLLAAFRENRANPQTEAANASHANVKTFAPVALPARDERLAQVSPRLTTRRTAFMATAIAASLALVALVTLYRQFTRTAPPVEITKNVAPQGGTEPSHIAPAVTPPVTPTVAPTVAPLSPAAAPADSTGETKHDGAQPSRQAVAGRISPGRASTATSKVREVPKVIESGQVIDGGSAIFAAVEGESAANQAGGAAKVDETERVTEFIPLVAGAPAAAPLESGQLVRVQLPRAALASLGLPLNAERGNEPVKADVLLGNDGLARAIRFVH